MTYAKNSISPIYAEKSIGGVNHFMIESGPNRLFVNAHSNHKGYIKIEVAGGGLSMLLDHSQIMDLADALIRCAQEVRRVHP